MYHFALVALMALAVLKVVDVLTDNIEALQRFRSLLTIAFGVGIVLWLDYSIFDGWNIAIEDRDTGLWLTGFMVAVDRQDQLRIEFAGQRDELAAELDDDRVCHEILSTQSTPRTQR